jgi:hypothetical protein
MKLDICLSVSLTLCNRESLTQIFLVLAMLETTIVLVGLARLGSFKGAYMVFIV